jgi:hypothetical protein
MARQWTLQIGNVTVMPRKNHPGEFDSNWLDRSKLQKGIELASDMSRTAFLKLVQFKMQRLSTDEQLEVQYALAKYFGIDPSDGGYAHYVKGITNVYMAIQVGLSAAYDIVVFDPTDKKAFTQAAGYVRPTRQMIQSGEKSAPLSPIRRRLNIPEEWHHHEWNSPWTGAFTSVSLSCSQVTRRPTAWRARSYTRRRTSLHGPPTFSTSTNPPHRASRTRGRSLSTMRD